MRRLALLTALAALAAAAPAAADVRIDGRGWGHGIGLSQYGAYGFALRENRSFRWILGHYYAGTRVATAPRARMRVRLKEGRWHRVSSASTLHGGGGRRLRVRPERVYRIDPLGTARLRVTNRQTGRVVARMRAPLRVTGRFAPRLLGVAENGVRDGRYRGGLSFVRDGGALVVVNDVDLERYLQGVVAGEMPASWPAEALKAQATVARSYALRSRGAGTWDVFADTRSQVYRGVLGEDGRATAAVNATRRLAVYAGDEIAQTFFFSTSGGRTAAVEEVWPSAPISYLRSAPDPHDDLSPYHRWSVTLTDAQLRRALRPVTAGALRGVAIVKTTPSGRAGVVRISGTFGERDISGEQARGLLGLRSTWFAIASLPARR